MTCMNDRERELEQALEHILRVLIAEYAPEKVILFGSLANKDVREWSDLDVVVVKDTAKPFPQRLREVALLCRPPVGVDFLVYTPREFAKMIADKNPFLLEEVLRKGKVVYESTANSAMA
jgi:predicted nucleotidyltransferase